jgi:hypothetical protein
VTFVDTHWPLAFGLLLVAGFGSWVFIHSDRSYLLRWAMIPLSLAVAVASAKVYDAGLGYAVPERLPPQFVYLGHQVVVERQHKAGIEVWARAARTRLYRIPYSKPMEKALDRAREQAKSGLPVVMHRQERSADPQGAMQGRQLAQSSEVYESNVLLPSQLDPKT